MSVTLQIILTIASFFSLMVSSFAVNLQVFPFGSAACNISSWWLLVIHICRHGSDAGTEIHVEHLSYFYTSRSLNPQWSWSLNSNWCAGWRSFKVNPLNAKLNPICKSQLNELFCGIFKFCACFSKNLNISRIKRDKFVKQKAFCGEGNRHWSECLKML